MSARRPLIGISASQHDFGDYGGVGVQRPLFAAGGLPLTLPQLPEAIEPALNAIDGLLLAPGRDIEPARYGQEPHPLLAATEPRRDAFELSLVPAAIERGLPILGMCRGIQTLNVALGGTLAQDVSLLSAEHPSDPGWTSWKRVEAASLENAPLPPHPRHEITIVAESVLARTLGTTTIEVNSFHHQAIDRLGGGLAVVASSADGVPEAVELPGREVLAVQWELNEEWRVDARFMRLPLHPWFHRHGFIERLQGLLDTYGPDAPLFPEVRPNKCGERRTKGERLYAGWLRDIGIKNKVDNTGDVTSLMTTTLPKLLRARPSTTSRQSLIRPIVSTANIPATRSHPKRGSLHITAHSGSKSDADHPSTGVNLHADTQLSTEGARHQTDLARGGHRFQVAVR